MAYGEATIYGAGQFYIQDSGTVPPVHTWDSSNGLLVTASIGAVVLTGLANGPIHVAVDARTEQPPEAEDAYAFGDGHTWDDIVEGSIACEETPLLICDLGHGFSQDLPRLDLAGPGSYRVRVHAKNRDISILDADGMASPTDQYLIVVWPEAARRPTLPIRLTDDRGLGTRMSTFLAGPPTTEPVDEPRVARPAPEPLHRADSEE